MSNEIEAGEYVKTKKGFIGKLINIDTKNEAYYLDCGKCVSLVNIIKHSKNIIDLIEEGDLINKHKVIKVINGFAEGTVEIKLLNNIKIYRNHSEDIKTILTHEQYEQNCYKLKEE